MSRKPNLLSKSRIVDGFGCEKKLFLNVFSPELKAPITPAKQQVFDQGNAIGERARQEFPNGYLLKADFWNTAAGIAESQEAIKAGYNTIFEAVFSDGQVHCRVDVLTRKKKTDPWDLIEVKSGTSLKEEYILDAAIQAFVLKSAGVSCKEIELMHINSECRYPGLANLFVREDITEEVNALSKDIGSKVKGLLSVLSKPKAPEKGIGRYCDAPYECDFKQLCWKDVPTPSVFELPSSWKLFEKGYLKLDDIPVEELGKAQKIPFKVSKSGKHHIDRKKIRASLKKFDPPFYHLDFETIGAAIPRFPGTRPYENVPMQFSLDLQSDFNESFSHFEYLHPDDSDPREAVADHLVKWIAKTGGSVVSYNAAFERAVLTKLADQFPKLKGHLKSIADRLIDPHPVVKASVYYPDFRGSFSIKAVAPALLGEEWSYDRLSVPDGKAAQRAFEEMVSVGTAAHRKSELRQHLLEYCAQDTRAMVELLNWLAAHQTE